VVTLGVNSGNIGFMSEVKLIVLYRFVTFQFTDTAMCGGYGTMTLGTD
jgi:hypothetical protein